MRVISADEAALKIATDLNAPPSPPGLVPQDLIIAEYARQALCDLTVSSGADRAAAYVTAVTNNVRRQLAAVWPGVATRRHRRPSQREQEAEGDLHPDPVRRVLDALSDLREVDHLGSGYYAPTPTRLVRLSDSTVLVVSGATTAAAERDIGSPIATSWIARTVCWQDLPDSLRSDATLWQACVAWLGAPPGDLESWTAAYLDRAKRQLGVSAGGLMDFEVYQPSLNRTRPQAFRWTPAKTLRGRMESLLLCRAFEGRFAIRRHWLGTLTRSRGDIKADREYPVDQAHLRRLQYGLDRMHGAPTQVRIRRTGTTARVTFTSLLPPEERRVFVAFGKDRSPKPGKLPIRYEVAEAHLSFILPLLEELGVVVVVE